MNKRFADPSLGGGGCGGQIPASRPTDTKDADSRAAVKAATAALNGRSPSHAQQVSRGRAKRVSDLATTDWLRRRPRRPFRARVRRLGHEQPERGGPTMANVNTRRPACSLTRHARAKQTDRRTDGKTCGPIAKTRDYITTLYRLNMASIFKLTQPVSALMRIRAHREATKQLPANR